MDGGGGHDVVCGDCDAHRRAYPQPDHESFGYPNGAAHDCTIHLAHRRAYPPPDHESYGCAHGRPVTLAHQPPYRSTVTRAHRGV